MTLFGEALRDCYRHRQKGTFYVCDDQNEYPLNLAYYLDIRLEPHEVELLKHARGRVLDVGCNGGRIMRYLEYKGLEVVGFDFDKIFIDLCKKQGLKQVHTASCRNMDKFGKFDTIVLLNHSVGTAGSREGLLCLLERCHDCCNSDGILIFDSLEIIMGESAGETGIIEKKLRPKYDEKYGKWFPWIHIGSGAAEKMLQETGWKIEESCRSCDRYAFICRKIDFREHTTPAGEILW